MSNETKTLFSPFELGNTTLANRVVMAPMTRSRAPGNIPGDMVVKYYADRATAGLIISEGVSPSPNGLGYARIPGIYSAEQVAAWKKVTDAVHEKGGKIFVQLMHTGRIGHALNLPAGARVVSASAIGVTNSPIYTDQEGMQTPPAPEAITDIAGAIQEFVQASENAIEAGFDGVELHGANGYLLDQFLNPASNQRTDDYGGTPEKRNRFVVEVASAVAKAIGKEKTGIRLSPFGAFNEMTSNEDTYEQFVSLATSLKEAGLVYIHIVDHAAMGAPALPERIKSDIREAFGGNIILSGGYDAERAEADLNAGKGELVAFGRPFMANPDLVSRLENNAPLTEVDMSTAYSADEKGYNDYAPLQLA